MEESRPWHSQHTAVEDREWRRKDQDVTLSHKPSGSGLGEGGRWWCLEEAKAQRASECARGHAQGHAAN